MKTQYFRRARRGITPRQGIAAALAGTAVLLLILLRVFFPGALTALVSPFWSAGSLIASVIRLPENSAALSAKVDALTAENEALSNENHVLAAKAGNKAKGAGIVAPVIARPPMSPYDVLIVAKGSDDGVYAGMRAYADGVPAGTVAAAAGTSARILLYSASGAATDGWIGDAHVPVTLKGLGAGAFTADVPREAPVAEGDPVYLPGGEGVAMGAVAKIDSNASSPRATLFIRPAANPFTMTSVVIVPSPSP